MARDDATKCSSAADHHNFRSPPYANPGKIKTLKNCIAASFARIELFAEFLNRMNYELKLVTLFQFQAIEWSLQDAVKLNGNAESRAKPRAFGQHQLHSITDFKHVRIFY